MTATQVKGAGAAVFVAVAVVIRPGVRCVGAMAGTSQVPEILRRLGQARSHHPDQSKNQETNP